MRASEIIKEYGVGKITSQNATADVKPGDEFKNVKKLQLASVGHQDKLTSPENTLVVNTPGDLDWYKIGQHYPTLAQQDPKEFGQSDSDMVITFANKAEKEKFMGTLDRVGMKYMDIGGTDIHPEIHGENPANEGKTSSRMALVALMAALASSPAHSDDPVKDAYDLSRQIYKARDLSQAGVEEEAKQELKNIMRAIQGHPNQSKILSIFKDMYKSNDKLEETIRKIGDRKWRLYSKDGKKNLGTFASLDAAKKHEREVQYFKHR